MAFNCTHPAFTHGRTSYMWCQGQQQFHPRELSKPQSNGSKKKQDVLYMRYVDEHPRNDCRHDGSQTLIAVGAELDFLGDARASTRERQLMVPATLRVLSFPSSSPIRIYRYAYQSYTLLTSGYHPYGCSWFTFSPGRICCEVRTTARGARRGLVVTAPYSSPVSGGP